MTKPIQSSTGRDALRELVIKWRKFADADHSQGMKVSDSRKQGQHELLMAGQSLAYATAAKELEAALAPPLIKQESETPDLETCDRCQKEKATIWVDTGFAGEREKLCGECVSIEYAQLEEKLEAGANKQEAVAPVGERIKGVALLTRLANSWIRIGQTSDGLRKDEYVTAHKEAIQGIYETCGETLLDYLKYEDESNPESVSPAAPPNENKK